MVFFIFSPWSPRSAGSSQQSTWRRERERIGPHTAAGSVGVLASEPFFFKSVSRPGHGALPPGGGQDSPESGFCAVLLAKSWGTQTPGLSLPHLWFSKTGADVESRFE